MKRAACLISALILSAGLFAETTWVVSEATDDFGMPTGEPDNYGAYITGHDCRFSNSATSNSEGSALMLFSENIISSGGIGFSLYDYGNMDYGTTFGTLSSSDVVCDLYTYPDGKRQLEGEFNVISSRGSFVILSGIPWDRLLDADKLYMRLSDNNDSDDRWLIILDFTTCEYLDTIKGWVE